MVLQKYQKFIEITSIMIYIVVFGVGLKCPRKIHLNTQWRGVLKLLKNCRRRLWMIPKGRARSDDP